MEDVFEPVLEVTEYFDGPRRGIALFKGTRHTFTSKFLDSAEYRRDFESVDIFELVPIDLPHGATAILANARFRTAAVQPTLEPGQLRALEACWQPIEQAGA